MNELMNGQGISKKKISGLRLCDMIISGVLFAFTFTLFLIVVITGNDPGNRLLTNIAVSALFLLPFLIEIIFNIKLTDFVLTFYLVFIFFSAFLGDVFMWFDVVPGYDKIIHGTFGYVGCIIGLFVLCKLADVKSLTPFFIVVVCFSISMMLETMWEVVEFLGDSFLGQTAQGKPILGADGTYVTSVRDSMLDILCNFAGCIVFTVHYVLHRSLNKNLLINTMQRDFSSPFEKRKIKATAL